MLEYRDDEINRRYWGLKGDMDWVDLFKFFFSEINGIWKTTWVKDREEPGPFLNDPRQWWG
jgi:hypothetical protein